MFFRENCVKRLPVMVFGLAVFISGCARQSPESAQIVEPPDQDAGLGGIGLEDAASDALRPGGLEMPAVEIPPTVDEPGPGKSEGIEMPPGVKAPEVDGAAVSPAIEYRSWAEVESLAKSSGRVTVVDLWSLACEPCLKEFPGLVRLHQTMGSKVQCIAVDLDFDGRQSRPPQYYEEQIVEFLTSVRASGFPTYISTTPSDDVFASADLPSIPAVLVFDVNGELAKAFVDAGDTAGFTYEKDVVPFVTKLAG